MLRHMCPGPQHPSRAPAHAVLAARSHVDDGLPDLPVPVRELPLDLRVAHDDVADRLAIAALWAVPGRVDQPFQDLVGNGVRLEVPARAGRPDGFDHVHGVLPSLRTQIVADSQSPSESTRMRITDVRTADTGSGAR